MSLFLKLSTIFLPSASVVPSLESKETVSAYADVENLDIKALVQSFLKAVSYDSPRVTLHKEVLEDAVNSEVQSWNADDGQGGKIYRRIAKQAAALIESGYYYHDFQVKLQFALYTWFMIFIDDLSTRMPLAIEEFQRRVVLGQPQLDPALDHFPQVFGNLYEYWDPVCANSMVCAALEFISGTVMEGKKEIENMKPHTAAIGWPRFLRAKTGIAPAYSCMVFPRGPHPDMSAFVQALPDMDDFINITNDILSFYKEDLAGEEMTFVQFRSKITGKPAKQVVAEIIQEVGESHNRIVAILEGHPDAQAAWKTFEDGYIAWHLSLDRYRLAELGLHA